MTVNLDAVGRSTSVFEVSWTADDALLYALSVGVGQTDPLQGLAFTTENSAGVTQSVLPTFGLILAEFRLDQDQVNRELAVGDFDPAQVLHAEQTLIVNGPLSPGGTLTVSGSVTGIYDKGSGALLEREFRATVPGDAEPLIVSRTSAFIRGEGGFGVRGPSSGWTAPQDEPDLTVDCGTAHNQALIYRLLGDRNPLHSDPAVAQRGGFGRPILHGLCAYGVVAHALLEELAGGDPCRFSSMSGRFSKPVYPGDALHIRVWRGDESSRFQVLDASGEPVLDRGSFVTGAAA